MLGLLLLACPTAPPPAEVVFVREGVIAPEGQGRRLADGRVLVDQPWTPGEVVRIGDAVGTAPERAECAELFRVPLGDVSRLIANGGEAPDTALAFSPDGARLAVGSYLGELVVVDAWTGADLARRRFDEALVKQVAWSADGRVLYVGEQSPDANLWALDADTLATRWSLRLADEVGTSPVPKDDLYGVYQLPGVLAVEVLPGGDLLVDAVRSWTEADGRRRNRSRLLRLSADGTRVAAFPADGAADATLLFPRVDAEGGRLVVPVTRSADGPPPDDPPIDAVLVLHLADLRPERAFRAAPLAPWYERTFVWETTDVDAARDVVVAGFGDGRVLAWRLSTGEVRAALELGTPVVAGAVPLAASVGFARLWGDRVLSVTSGTGIPYGAADPSLRPPAAHPHEHTLWAHRLDGGLDWTWRGPYALQGLTAAPDGHLLVVGAGQRATDDRRDLFGALVFDDRRGGSGERRLVAVCATESPVFFRHAVAPDGRIAVIEVPWDAAGAVAGHYRATVFR